MKLNRRSWGYIPVALVLGLIWFEFWRSGAFRPADPGAPPAAPETPDAAVVAPATPTTPGVVAPETPVTPAPVVTIGPPRTPVVPVAPVIGALPPVQVAVPVAVVKPVMDDAFLHNPPPINVSLAGESLNGAVDLIRESFHMPANFSLQTNGGGNNAVYTLEAKNKPFWEVIRSMQAQGGFGFYPNGNGLVVSSSYSPVYNFEINGPAILFPSSVTYARSVSAQDPGSRSTGMYQITFGAAVDPRITLAHNYPVEVMEATDEAGRPIPLSGRTGATNSGAAQTNSWSSIVMIPESTPRAKTLNLKCQVRFAALLTNGSATVEDATSKQGEVITLGDHKWRLTRCEVQGTNIFIQVTPEDGGAAGTVNCSLTGSNGQSTNFTIGGGTQSFPMQVFPAPCTLTFRDTSGGQELSFPFEIKDLPLP